MKAPLYRFAPNIIHGFSCQLQLVGSSSIPNIFREAASTGMYFRGIFHLHMAVARANTSHLRVLSTAIGV